MPASDVIIKGAREHNLQNVDLVIPRNKLVCLTGVSGSGKSSLAFDTLYAEGQRRYVESLSSFARQFLGQMPKPEVDFIGGLSPSISISQKTAGSNPRSTVGTITEIYDYLRVLFARVGDGHCHHCDRPITAQTREQILARVISLPHDTKFSVLAPIIRGQKGEYKDLFADLLKQGFIRARVDGTIVSLSDDLQLDRQMRHHIEVVIDRLVIKPSIRNRLAEAIETAIKIGKGNLVVAFEDADESTAPADPEHPESGNPTLDGSIPTKSRRRKPVSANPNDLILSVDYACTHCGISFEPPSPQLFSFNSPQGMCTDCDGLGEFYSFDVDLLIPDPSLSVKQGCIATIEPWKDLGRWRRHIYQGVAETIERKLNLEEGYLLGTAWQDLNRKHQDLLLWGTGEQHITFTWRAGKSPQKYGGKFEGIIPELLSKYRNSRSKMQIRSLERYMNTVSCPTCRGERLNQQARSVTVSSKHSRFADQPKKTLPEVCRLAVSDAVDFFRDLELDATRTLIATEVMKEIRGRLGFLMNVGLDYLSLDRSAPTLSGGESQRIRLAGQIGCGLVGVLYILDEPSIGLHPRDNDRLIDTLGQLRDLGNTVIVVEHDEDTMLAADHIIDFGPGPGVRGGKVVAEGSFDNILKSKTSITAKYLSGRLAIDVPEERRITEGTRFDGPAKEELKKSADEKPAKRRRVRIGSVVESLPKPADNWLTIVGAKHNNLKNIDVSIPLGSFVCVTGVSGSGKSSLVNDILVQALKRDLNGGEGEPGEHQTIVGLRHLDKLIAIDQSPIGRTPRSNPGTYIKVFDDIRTLFTQLPESKQRGYKPGRFSFNVKGGRCEACEGNGSTRLEMDFLADVWVTCPVCNGARFNRETLGVKFKDKSISDILDMDIQESLTFFENLPKIKHKLQTLHDVGLDYLKIGQPSPTLSGGEAQRIKLARELVKVSTGQTMYLLDEPTTGLHFADIELLLKVLHNFVEVGNTVLVVEHNLDVVKTADWVIDLGPEGGDAGGRLVATGTPEQIARVKESHTGKALAKVLKTTRTDRGSNRKLKPHINSKNGRLTKQIEIQGASQHNLKNVSLKIPRDEMTVFCGPSGSGKSSLAMDTIYAEGQRRYVESLSSYARQFVSQMQKPQIENVEGLSPAIAIEQQNLSSSPRSTVGTSTEIYDYLRILLARLGTPHCPACDVPIGTQTSDQIVDKILAEEEGTRLYLMAPCTVDVGQKYETLWEELKSLGYVRIRVDGFTYDLDKPPKIDRRRMHAVEVVVDRIIVREKTRGRIAESVEGTLALGRGVLHVAYVNEKAPEPRWRVRTHSQHLACEECGNSYEPLTPHNFSFNSQLGWCEACEGLGIQTGANPTALVHDGRTTLAEGAIKLWPDVDRSVSQWMLSALSEETGLPNDVPFEELDGRQRRTVMYGTGDTWMSVYPKGRKSKNGQPLFQFQYKGLYPALEEAARLSPSLRSKLESLVDDVECGHCGGSRLREDAAAVRFRGYTIDQLCRQPLGTLQETVKRWKLNVREKRIAGELLREIKNRVQFLNDVGLHYLSLSRKAGTLSGGEAQRIRLASQLGSGLCGVLYVLDEPTIGLHPRDNHRLVSALYKLRDLGNTLLLVEHDREVIEGCDNLVDFGPAAGKHGGEIVAKGTPASVSKRQSSVTGPYLSGKKAIGMPSNRRIGNDEAEAILRNGPERIERKDPTKKVAAKKVPAQKQKATTVAKLPVPKRAFLTVRGARHNNLRSIDVAIPLGTLTAITGVSGSGKSSLVNDVLYASLAKTLHRAGLIPGAHDAIEGLENINKVVRVDQQPLGNSPTSNPATYTGCFELIRVLYSKLPESKIRGYTQRRFSFNVPGGRCEECEGNGQICIEMHFLPDVWVECESCRGRRYNEETLTVEFRGHSISDVLDMTCGEATALFQNIPKVRKILQTLCDVGLDYLTLGQPAPTLSGGEAQRVKLAAELSRPDTGRTLYLLDEPTTGLHFEDLRKLLDVLNRLVDLGNTVVVIEHNLDVVKTADWIIDIGPDAGEAGGRVVAVGTPEQIIEHVKKSKLKKTKVTASKNPKSTNGATSYTAMALKPVLDAGPYVEREVYDPSKQVTTTKELDIDDVGKDSKMPWQIDGRQWHAHDRVGRKGEPCKWNGCILENVIDRIQDQGDFGPTDWNSRTVVEISGKTKSHGWFFHAITGETWLLKMKFRVSKGTFRKETILEKFQFKTLNEMDELPVYGNDSRVKCKTLRGPWQEVEFRVHSFEEIDTPEFRDFLDKAVAGFQAMAERVESNPEDLMPWKKLGKKWHFNKRGFLSGTQSWPFSMLETLCDLIEIVAGDGEFVWTNKVLIHYHLAGDSQPWATIVTKRPENIELILTGPTGQFGLGRITGLADEQEVDGSKDDVDIIRLRFRTPEDLKKGDLKEFLVEHRTAQAGR